MITAESKSVADSSASHIQLPRSWALLCGAAAGLCLCVFPGRFPTPTLDPSWQAVLNYAALHHLQFGTDIVFTYGPLGYLAQNQYSPGTWWRVVVFQILSRALYLALLWSSLRCTSQLCDSRAKWFLFLLLAGILPAMDGDSFYLLFITLLGLNFCQERVHWLHFCCLAIIAATGLIKGTYLAFGLLTLMVVMVWCAANSHLPRALLVLGVFILSFAFSWRVIGHQQFAHIAVWLGTVLEITKAYQLTMGIAPNLNQLSCGILVFVGLGGALLFAFAREWRSWAVVLIIAGGLFLAWKQGFIRALDYEPKTFFIYALVISAAMPLFLNFCLDRTLFIFLLGLSLGCSLLARFPVPPYRAFENARFILRLPSLNRSFAAQTRNFDLPNMRAMIGSASVDVTGAEQAIAILNGFNYRPAPVFQTYVAGTPKLAQLNAAFFCSDKAPDFIIVPPEYRVDDRLPNLDASLSGLVIQQRYQEVLVEKGYHLLKSTNASYKAPETGIAIPLKLGQSFPVHPGDWCRLDMHESLLGRLTRFLWASPPVYVDVWQEGGGSTRYRFLPSLGTVGFVVPRGTIGMAISKMPGARWCISRQMDVFVSSPAPAK